MANNKLAVGEQVDITYTVSRSGEVSQRRIIPVSVPDDQIRALDVTHSTEADRLALEQALNEYREYRELAYKRLFSFEDFLEHAGIAAGPVTWRAFKLSGISRS